MYNAHRLLQQAKGNAKRTAAANAQTIKQLRLGFAISNVSPSDRRYSSELMIDHTEPGHIPAAPVALQIGADLDAPHPLLDDGDRGRSSVATVGGDGSADR